jgi:O-antigen/teichoic acid export membrane protein
MASAGGWLLIGATVSRAAAVVSVLVVSRILAPPEFGRFSVMQSAVLVASAVAGLGLVMAATRQVAAVRGRDPEAAGRYLGTAVWLTVIGGVVVVAAFVLGRTALANVILQDRTLAELVPAAAAAVGALAMFGIAQAGLSSLEAFRSIAAAQGIQSTLSTVGLIAGAFASGATGALFGFSCAQAAAATWAVLRLSREAQAANVHMRWGLGRRERRSLARYALPGFAALFSVSAALLGGQIILSSGPDAYADVAAFSVAYRWHLAIIFIPTAFAPALLPILTRQRAEEDPRARRTLGLTLVATMGIATLPALLVALSAPLLLRLNGEFYAAHPLPLVILAAAAVPCALNTVLSNAAISVGAVRAWLISDFVLAVGVLGTAAALVPSLHASGLALAYLVGYMLTVLTLLPAVRRHARPAIGTRA